MEKEGSEPSDSITCGRVYRKDDESRKTEDKPKDRRVLL
jgi:hypothetical protein